MDEDKKEKGGLMKTFGKYAMKATSFLAGVFVGAVIGDFFLGSTLIHVSHGSDNPYLVAWNAFTYDMFDTIEKTAVSVLEQPFFSEGVLEPYLADINAVQEEPSLDNNSLQDVLALAQGMG